MRRVRQPAHVPELEEDLPALGVHRIDDELPAGDLLRRVDARRAREPAAVRRDLRRLTDDEATLRGALAVVLGHHRVSGVAMLGAHAGERRHHHAVGQRQAAEREWREEILGGHGEALGV